jgi:hypothetical protein
LWNSEKKQEKTRKEMFRQWCVMFKDGTAKVLVGSTRDNILMKNEGIKSIFRMGIVHSNPKDKNEQ